MLVFFPHKLRCESPGNERDRAFQEWWTTLNAGKASLGEEGGAGWRKERAPCGGRWGWRRGERLLSSDQSLELPDLFRPGGNSLLHHYPCTSHSWPLKDNSLSPAQRIPGSGSFPSFPQQFVVCGCLASCSPYPSLHLPGLHFPASLAVRCGPAPGF